MVEAAAIPGFERRELDRLAMLWAQLTPHLMPQEYYLVGGAAIRPLLGRYGRSSAYIWRNFRDNEYNLVALHPHTVSPSLLSPGSGFVLMHYHLEKTPGGLSGPYWQVLHPATRVRFNIFPPRSAFIPTQLLDIADRQVPVQGLLDQYLSILQDCLKPLRGEAVDPKQIRDVIHLWPLVLEVYSLQEVQQRWLTRQPGYPLSAEQAYYEVTTPGYGQELIKPNPFLPTVLQLLRSLPRRGCPECLKHPHFRPARGAEWMLRYAIRR